MNPDLTIFRTNLSDRRLFGAKQSRLHAHNQILPLYEVKVNITEFRWFVHSIWTLVSPYLVSRSRMSKRHLLLLSNSTLHPTGYLHYAETHICEFLRSHNVSKVIFCQNEMSFNLKHCNTILIWGNIFCKEDKSCGKYFWKWRSGSNSRLGFDQSWLRRKSGSLLEIQIYKFTNACLHENCKKKTIQNTFFPHKCKPKID